jgi:hypothetical protein
MNVKEALPWWAKMAAKIVLARIPLKSRQWEKLGLFVHGQMDTPEYAFGVVTSHLGRVGWTDLRGKSVLELGPGDGLFTALIAKALGSEQVYLVDADPAAAFDIEMYRLGCDFLRQAGLAPPDLSRCETVDEMLRLCSTVYLTDGLASLAQIPDHSVDLIFSQAVLEHVRIAEFSATLDELRRIISANGVTSHEVDLKDHLARALNNLRFSTRIWESSFMVNSGFYTNRLRFPEILELFDRAGFRVEPGNVNRWNRPPTDPRLYAAEFQGFSEEDLLVSEFDLLAFPT